MSQPKYRENTINRYRLVEVAMVALKILDADQQKHMDLLRKQ